MVRDRKLPECTKCRSLAYGSQTLAQLRAQHGTSTYHSVVRAHSRAAYGGTLACAACGYDIHVEICHIRGVAEFPTSATLAEVNAPANLIALDKRCHWELDHGYLIITDGQLVRAR